MNFSVENYIIICKFIFKINVTLNERNTSRVEEEKNEWTLGRKLHFYISVWIYFLMNVNVKLNKKKRQRIE